MYNMHTFETFPIFTETTYAGHNDVDWRGLSFFPLVGGKYYSPVHTQIDHVTLTFAGTRHVAPSFTDNATPSRLAPN